MSNAREIQTSKSSEGSGPLEKRIRSRIESLSYLPTTVAIALKFIELGKDPDPDPAVYARVIGSDTSLSVKLLALANSSWFGIRNKVTTVRMAVNLLGLGTVRTLAMSHCMAGLHNELRLRQEEARLFWGSALCKAVAAREFTRRAVPDQADEAFAAGMFQDLALSVMYAEGRESYLEILKEPDDDIEALLRKERDLFGMDHSGIGLILAQKLDLPMIYADAIAWHHEPDRLAEAMEPKVFGDAVCVASLFPHILSHWRKHDADRLCAFLAGDAHDGPADTVAFLESVQQEFDKISSFIEGTGLPESRLADLLIEASRNQADDVSYLTGTVNELRQKALCADVKLARLSQEHDRIRKEARHDPLSGLLNRRAFMSDACDVISQATRNGFSLAVVYLDIDKFKSANDRFGHAFGDEAIAHVARSLRQSVRSQDRAARMGGDEFVLLLCDYDSPQVHHLVQGILDRVGRHSIRAGQGTGKVTLSAGVLYIRPGCPMGQIETLVQFADKLMYEAKRAGGYRVRTRIL